MTINSLPKPHTFPRVRQNSRIDVYRRILSHPAIQMPIPLKHNPIISLLLKRRCQRRIRLVRRFGTIHHILRAVDKQNRETSDILQVFGCDEGFVAVVGDMAVCAHVHEVLEGGHCGSAEEFGHVSVGCFIELFVGPQPRVLC
jgi:hypothetical protein